MPSRWITGDPSHRLWASIAWTGGSRFGSAIRSGKRNCAKGDTHRSGALCASTGLLSTDSVRLEKEFLQVTEEPPAEVCWCNALMVDDQETATFSLPQRTVDRR